MNKLPNYASTIQKLKVLPVEERRICRSIFLLRQLIRASEKNGTHHVRPHASLSKGQMLGSIQVQNNLTHGDQFRNRFEIAIDSH